MEKQIDIKEILENQGLLADVFQYSEDEAVVANLCKNKFYVVKVDTDKKLVVLAFKEIQGAKNLEVRHAKNSGVFKKDKLIIFINSDSIEYDKVFIYDTFTREFHYTNLFDRVYFSELEYKQSFEDGNLCSVEIDRLNERNFMVFRMKTGKKGNSIFIRHYLEQEEKELHLGEELEKFANVCKINFIEYYYVIMDEKCLVKCICRSFEEAMKAIEADYWYQDTFEKRELDYLVGKNENLHISPIRQDELRLSTFRGLVEHREEFPTQACFALSLKK